MVEVTEVITGLMLVDDALTTGMGVEKADPKVTVQVVAPVDSVIAPR